MRMKTIPEHIKHLQEKPHYVRKRVTFGIAAFGSAFVALVWLVGGLSLGAFAIQGSTFAESTALSPVIVAGDEAPRVDSGIAGVAGAFSGTDAPAHIEIVDAAASTSAKAAEKTTIPF